jgi:hypothetical protein
MEGKVMSERWIRAEDLVGLPGMPDTLEGVEDAARVMGWKSRPSLDALIDSAARAIALMSDQDAEDLVLALWSLIVGIDDHFDDLYECGEQHLDLGREMLAGFVEDGYSRRAAIDFLFAESVGVFDGMPDGVARVLAYHADHLASHWLALRARDVGHA